MNSNKRLLHSRRDTYPRAPLTPTALNSSYTSSTKLDLSFTHTLSSESRKPPYLPRSVKFPRPPIPPLKSRNISRNIPDDFRTREFDMFSYQEFRKSEIKLSRKISSACHPFMYDEDYENTSTCTNELNCTLSSISNKAFNIEDFKKWHETQRQEVTNRKETGV